LPFKDSSAVAEAEAAVVAAGLAADDTTGVGVADDIAILFVLLGAAAMFWPEDGSTGFE